MLLSDTSSPNLFFKGKPWILCYVPLQQRAKIAPHWKGQFYSRIAGVRARKQQISLLLCGCIGNSICASINKAYPKIRRARLHTLVRHADQAAVACTFNPSSQAS